MKLKLFAIIAFLFASPVLAQGTGISLSPTSIDAAQPVEVTADNLTVEQEANTATFSGNAKVVQGELILAAQKIRVFYNAEQSAIQRVEATSDVVFTNGAEVAEAQNGVYYVSNGQIDLTGDVVLVQGVNAISGNTLTLDLKTGRGKVSGNVKTVFVPKTSK